MAPTYYKTTDRKEPRTITKAILQNTHSEFVKTIKGRLFVAFYDEEKAEIVLEHCIVFE